MYRSEFPQFRIRTTTRSAPPVRLLNLIGSLILLVSSLSVSQAQEGVIQEKIDRLLSRYQQTDAPGIVVRITEKGSIRYLKGHGIANLETSQALTPTTVFDVASLAKQFTGMAIAILAEEESLSLEAPITSYLADLPECCESITVSQLLEHTSGIRDWPGLLVLGGLRLEDSITLEDIHALVKNQQTLNFQPGEDSLYTNTGYNLLALIVEAVTKRSFSDWTTQRLFDPLGMKDSFFHQTQGRLIQRLAHSYAPSDNRNWKEIGNQLTAVGSSSLYTTMEDLLKWVQHFDGVTLLKKGDDYNRLLTKRSEPNSDTRYQWGLLVGTHKGERQFLHGGAWAGFKTNLIYLPERQLGVVALSNRYDTDVESISYKILDLFMQPSQTLDTAVPAEKKSKTVAAPKEDLAWIGHYQTGNNASEIIQISNLEGQYRIQIDDHEAVPLSPLNPNQYEHIESDLKVSFSTEHIGWPRKLSLISPSMNLNATETIPWRQAENQTYEGIFYSDELKTEYRVSTTQTGLTATHHRHGDIDLHPSSTDRFVSKTWFWKQVEFKRNPEGQTTALEITQTRNRGILFTRRGPTP
jgi:CubicO group peptidase (beta-lactamase class C family)